MALPAQTWPFPWPEDRIGRYTARRASSPIVIDGRLDEADWRAAERSPRFADLIGGRPGLPDTRAAVLIFGLFHGFGLATKLQELALSREGLVANIVSFNVGVEIGQFLALTAVLLALGYWRTRAGYLRHAYMANAALMTAGFLLTGYQLAGYFVAPR